MDCCIHDASGSSFHFPVLDELHYILLQQNETANIARGNGPPGGTPSTWSHKRHQNYTGLIYFLLVMNQFRKVVARSGLGMLLVFSRNLNVSLGVGDLQSHYPLLVGQDQECWAPLFTTISYRLENPGNEGLQAGVLSLAGQEEEMAP